MLERWLRRCALLLRDLFLLQGGGVHLFLQGRIQWLRVQKRCGDLRRGVHQQRRKALEDPVGEIHIHDIPGVQHTVIALLLSLELLRGIVPEGREIADGHHHHSTVGQAVSVLAQHHPVVLGGLGGERKVKRGPPSGKTRNLHPVRRSQHRQVDLLRHPGKSLGIVVALQILIGSGALIGQPAQMEDAAHDQGQQETFYKKSFHDPTSSELEIDERGRRLPWDQHHQHQQKSHIHAPPDHQRPGGRRRR